MERKAVQISDLRTSRNKPYFMSAENKTLDIGKSQQAREAIFGLNKEIPK
jgi:hypothetical protein